MAGLLGRQSRVINALRPLYETLLMRWHGGRGIPWTINGEPFRIDPRYRPLVGEHWDPEVAAFLAPRLQQASVCLDIGANAGVYVLQLCRWTQPEGRVIAFEPNPHTRRVLQTHVEMNGYESRVKIVPCAVSSHNGKSDFFFTNMSGMSRLGQPNTAMGNEVERTEVETVTLDQFCGQHGMKPDCLLIDIEGFELHALRGARALLAACPTMQVVVEMHPSLWPSAGTTVADWEAFFVETGLRPEPLMGQNDPLADMGSVVLRHPSALSF